MSKICSMHQPSYLPWPPFFGKMAACDAWVHVDNVAFYNKGVQERHKIKGPNGAYWLTVPVHHSMGEPIYSIKIDTNTLRRYKHWKNIKSNYEKALYFRLYESELYKIYNVDWEKLVDLNLALLDFFCKHLNIHCEQYISSKLDNIPNDRNRRIIDLCKYVKADIFIAGSGGIRYMDMELFRNAGIEVIFQLPKIKEYSQLWHRVGFIPGLSTLDLLLNLGPDAEEYVKNCFELVDESTLKSRLNEVPEYNKNIDEQDDEP